MGAKKMTQEKIEERLARIRRELNHMEKASSPEMREMHSEIIYLLVNLLAVEIESGKESEFYKSYDAVGK
jgi:hypothetical protein